MPRKRKTKRTKSVASPVDVDQFLRSINVELDADSPERIAHFRPTSKCAVLIKALLGQEAERCFLVTAPYGTGKSLPAAYLLQLIENRPAANPELWSVAKRLKDVSPELAGFAKKRLSQKSDSRGIVVALHGHCADLPGQIKRAIVQSIGRIKRGRQLQAITKLDVVTIEDAITLLVALKEKCSKAGIDRVAIVWDEFGRHLETIIAEGRGETLNEVQLLAEFAARTTKIPFTLGLLLHQGLLHYAGAAPQTVRKDWKKIEGRFQTIQYVDDSKELYRLIGDVVSHHRKNTSLTAKDAKTLARSCHRNGLFTDFTNKEDLAELIRATAPLDPVTLYLLPRVSARIAQNERTIFGFIHETPLDEAVTAESLYDFFSPAMRADTSVGGTHRQWLETESALSKVQDTPLADIVLKATCLLGFGTGGERSRTSRELVEFSMQTVADAESITRTLNSLLGRKLLLHRRHNDEVSVWHGTDVDLRGRLEEEKANVRRELDLVEFLTREAPPEPWLPTHYNAQFCLRRFFEGEFRTIGGLSSTLNWDMVVEGLPIDCDGRILYLVAESQEELAEAERLATEQLHHDRLLVVIPQDPLPLTDGAAEVEALGRMQNDTELLESDPLALAEIQQMADDSRHHLQQLIDRLLQPSDDGPRWFSNGSELHPSDARELRIELSEISKRVYGKTPAINNEMIVRKKPSAIVVNSRKKLMIGILERHGQEELGIDGNFPDKSLFRSVLLNTKLYRFDSKSGTWDYVHPKNIRGNAHLKHVWEAFRLFVTEPSDTPKSFESFFQGLQLPPIGLRAGLIPIFLAASFKAFPTAMALSHQGEYVEDILPTVIESICKAPNEYSLSVPHLDETRLEYLREIQRMFAKVDYEVDETDLIRWCFDAIAAWKSQLPPAALTTNRISATTLAFRNAISRTNDPMRTLLDRLPKVLETPLDDAKLLLEKINHSREELEGVIHFYISHAADSLRRAVGMRSPNDETTARDVGRQWSECFSDEVTSQLSDGVAKGFLSRLKMPYDSDEQLLNSLAALLIGKQLSRWDDSTTAIFDRELHSLVHRLESAAIGSLSTDAASAAPAMSQLITARLDELYAQLEQLVGPNAARDHLATLGTESQHVDDAGRPRQPIG